MFVIKNSKPVELNDNVRFRCKRCAECCRHVEGSVILEPLDAYNLAKHLNMNICDVYERYADVFILSEDVFYPIFALKTTGDKKACIFLKGNRCSVQEAKPRTCRMYPFWIEPDEGGLKYNLSSERSHHPKGSLIKVKDWVRKNLKDEEKEVLESDIKTIQELALLIKSAQNVGISNDEILKLVLLYRYYGFETERPFLSQKKTFDKLLLNNLKNMIIKRKEE